jgi:hypothetical protein
MRRPVILLVLLPFVLAGCPAQVVPPGKVGSLSLSFEASGLAAKTIVPPIDMDVTDYNISGNGPGGDSFSETGVTAATFSKSALGIGEWAITVDAFNAAHELIGGGSTTVSIVAEETAHASVQVVPLSGTGTLTIDISWTAGLISDPSVSATLTPMGSLAFITGANSASYSSGDTLSAGYHSLALQVMDGGVAVWGFFEAIRILRDQTTEASFYLTPQDLQ